MHRSILAGVILVSFLASVHARGASAEGDADFATTTEAKVGANRVVLLSVTRTSQFLAGEQGKPSRAVTSVRLTYLVERLGDGDVSVVAAGAEMFEAGTTDKALVDPTRRDRISITTENLEAYAKRIAQSDADSATKMPAVKNAAKAVVVGVNRYQVQVTAKKVDIRVKVGTATGEDDSVVFKNVPLE